MNLADISDVDERAFSFLDMTDQETWLSFAPVFGSLTVVGAPSYSGRFRFVGRGCQFEVQFSAATSIASVAGTDYLNLPVTAKGLSGMAVMTDGTAKTAVGGCHIDVTNSRAYLPSQAASAHVFTIAGWYEV